MNQGDMGNLRNVLLVIQHRLLQMGNAPALGNIEGKQCGQYLCSLSGDSVLPSSKGHKHIPILVKSQLALYHSGDTHTL